MPNPVRLTPKALVVGGRYLHINRLFIRQIDAIEGDMVRTENRFLGCWRGFRELPKNLQFLTQNLREFSVTMCTKTCTKMIRTD